MKDQFPWYFLTETDRDEIWKRGTLTVDANVLLDLYRYHSNTRDDLLSAMESFRGRIWISHQTSVEFIRNRHSVIADISSDFEKSAKPVQELRKAISDAVGRLRAFRIIPKEPIAKFEEELNVLTGDMLKHIETERTAAPNFRASDVVVERLIKLFGKSVGPKPSDIEDALKEAARRTAAKIPPGYMDNDKDGVRSAGDYLMWRQIIQFGAEQKQSMIFITSERKEDWWEIKGSKTLGPRPELLQEAFEASGCHFSIYQTEHFLKLHQSRKGQQANSEALSEIREVAEIREEVRRPAVSVFQEVVQSDDGESSGTLKISLSREVYNITGTGRFEPQLRGIPRIDAKLITSPEGVPNNLIRANTGTKFDFNIHIHSAERGKHLPLGDYVVQYFAVVDDIFS